MKKTFRLLNIIIFLIACLMTVYYDIEGGLWLKGLTGSCFVLLGILNLIYAIRSKAASLRFPIWTVLGLLICLTGDIVLNISFLPGVGIFALGHICYIVAFCCMDKPRKTDVLPITLLFALALAIIKLVPALDFGSALVENLCIVYGLVISCMVGKTVSNYLHQKDTANLIFLIGSCLFYFSDVMLVLCRFGNAPKITDTLCLFSYFPAQCLIASAVYQFTNKECKS